MTDDQESADGESTGGGAGEPADAKDADDTADREASDADDPADTADDTADVPVDAADDTADVEQEPAAASVGDRSTDRSAPLGDEELTMDGVHDALQAVGRPVATADQLARELDASQAEASEALDDLAETRALERLDVSHDPVVYYPREWGELARSERVVPFPSRREIVVDQPTQYTRARLSQFARLVEADEGRYLYEVRSEDVWGAPYDSLTRLLEAVRAVLPERAPDLEGWIADQWARAGKFRLYTHEDGYVVLEAESESLMGNVARPKFDDGQLRAPISDSESWVAEGAVAEVKRRLYEAGYPVKDDRDLESGDPVEFELDLELREYQRDWAERFLDAGSGVLVGPPGSGKTVAAMGIAAEIGGESLILVPSRELAAQWREELLTRTTLSEDQIGEYHGGTKQVRPFTIATYQTAGMDRHRRIFDDREWGLLVFDECLAGNTTVETRAGRTHFDELDEQLELDAGWNRTVDFDVRTFEPGHGYQWTAVRGVYKTATEVFRIETNTGQTIEATENHTHLVFDPETFEIHEQQGIEEGDFLIRPSPQSRSTDPSEAVPLAQAELPGWFLGDGHCTRNDDVKFSFARHAREQIGILRDLAEQIETDYSVYGNDRGDLTIRLPEFATTCPWELPSGAKADTVSAPARTYRWSDDEIGVLLRGLFDAEGSASKKGRVQINTVSTDLIADVERLLQKLGIVSRRFCLPQNDQNHNDLYRLTIPTEYNPAFRERVGFRMTHKRDRLRDGTSAAIGVPVGPALSTLKSDVGVTNQQIAEMASRSRQTIGDVIRGRYRLGQNNLPELGRGLSTFVSNVPADRDARKDAFGVTYEMLSEEMGCATTTAHRAFQNGAEEAMSALQNVVDRRRARGAEIAEMLDALSDISLHEVVNVESIGEETVYDLETESHTFLADGFLTHNCHHIPAPVFRRSTDLQSKHRLGLTATPVREGDDESDIYTLIGPPIGTDWDALFEAGYVAEPEVELRFVPWGSEAAREEYDASGGHDRRQAAATNPAKVDHVQDLLAEHPDVKALVFVDYLDQGEAIAEAIDAAFVSGETRHASRERLLSEFRAGARDRLVVSRVGDEGIDLPEAELAVVASGLGGSRRQGAQRAGRTMRPAGKAQVYVLATRGTEEEDFARQRTHHLAGKGVRVREVHVEDAPASGE